MIWRLKSGLDRRFRAGHPWVFSNELQGSPKGVEPGAPIELHDPGGKFLARGFGNPSSLIAFRTVSRDPDESEPLAHAGLLRRLKQAERLRVRCGFEGVSHRLCFGEADGLPGLIIDRYSVGTAKSESGQFFVVQAHSAGMDRVLGILKSVLEELSGDAWARTGVIFRNDVSVRNLEGLEPAEPELVRPLAGVTPTHVPLRILATDRTNALVMEADLLGGQKTGFFLDQWANIRMTAELCQFPRGEAVKILDICSYVGHWGAQLAHRLWGEKIEVTAFDASESALAFAKKNLHAAGATSHIVKGDALEDLATWEARAFDVVIADPPALIKNRKHMPQGKHAYLQLFTQAIRLTKSGGLIVASSCSGLLDDESFREILAKAVMRDGREVRWVGRGGHSPDHPVLAEFPEGSYLKAWVGRVV